MWSDEEIVSILAEVYKKTQWWETSIIMDIARRFDGMDVDLRERLRKDGTFNEME